MLNCGWSGGWYYAYVSNDRQCVRVCVCVFEREREREREREKRKRDFVAAEFRGCV